MLGVYYLHTNGDLIWKPKIVFTNTTVEEYMDSPFVVKYWIIPEDPPGTFEESVHFVMDFLFDAMKLSRDPKRTRGRVREVCNKQGYPDLVADRILQEFDNLQKKG